MCLIYHSNEPLEEFEFNYYSICNPDGIGIYNYDKNKIYKFNNLSYKKYLSLAKGKHIIHFRLATHGSKSIDNIHPFKIKNHLYLFHNGVINIKTINDFSDTKTLCHVLKNCPFSSIVEILSHYSLEGNKFILVDISNNQTFFFGNFIKEGNKIYSSYPKRYYNNHIYRNVIDRNKTTYNPNN